jgi:hypothetical protein
VLTVADISGWTRLLRQLAGRLPDSDLAALRSALGVREIDDLERSLKHVLTQHGIEFNAEFDLVSKAPEVRFEPSEEPAAADEQLIAAATTYPTLQRVLKARRLDDKTIYVVELAAGEDVSQPQAALHWGLGEALLEVVAVDEELPPYQAAALASGRQIWPTT